MKKKENRIQLKHGTAVVDKNIKQATVHALNHMVECAYEQVISDAQDVKAQMANIQ